jgi:hypothetical protein
MEVDFDFIGFIGSGNYKKRASVAPGNGEKNKGRWRSSRTPWRASSRREPSEKRIEISKKRKEEEIAAEAGHHEGHCPCRMGSPNSQL